MCIIMYVHMHLQEVSDGLDHAKKLDSKARLARLKNIRKKDYLEG